MYPTLKIVVLVFCRLSNIALSITRTKPCGSVAIRSYLSQKLNISASVFAALRLIVSNAPAKSMPMPFTHPWPAKSYSKAAPPARRMAMSTGLIHGRATLINENHKTARAMIMGNLDTCKRAITNAHRQAQNFVYVQLIGNGAPMRIRTSDLCLRRAALYPAELWVLYTLLTRNEMICEPKNKARVQNP